MLPKSPWLGVKFWFNEEIIARRKRQEKDPLSKEILRHSLSRVLIYTRPWSNRKSIAQLIPLPPDDPFAVDYRLKFVRQEISTQLFEKHKLELQLAINPRTAQLNH